MPKKPATEKATPPKSPDKAPTPTTSEMCRTFARAVATGRPSAKAQHDARVWLEAHKEKPKADEK